MKLQLNIDKEEFQKEYWSSVYLIFLGWIMGFFWGYYLWG